MDDLEFRVAALERSNRRYKLLLVGAATLAVIGAGQGVPDKVQAKAFEVVDDSGKVLASMSNYQGSGAVTTFNAQGKYLTDIVPTKSGSGGVVTYDGSGKQILALTDVVGGGGSIVVKTADGTTVISLGHNNVGAGSMSLLNKDGKQIVLATSDTNHAGAVLTYDQDAKQTGRMPSGSQ